MKKRNNILSIILPSKRINILMITIILLAITMGAIYANMLNINDHNLVIDKIKTFISNIGSNNINGIILFKNSLSINLIYVFLIWLFGLTIFGSIIAIVMLFIKNFIFGFSMASFIITYRYKGLILSFIYLIFGEFINIIVTLIIAIYSFTYFINFIKKYLNNNIVKERHTFFKQYMLILAIGIILSIISAITSSFGLPAVVKLIVKLYQ